MPKMRIAEMLALRRGTSLIRAGVYALLLCGITPLFACDSDTDCPGGGTCIKREKRASGVCYGGGSPTLPGASPPTAPIGGGAVGGSLKLPPGACIVTQDCPAGLECVVEDYLGKCMKVPE